LGAKQNLGGVIAAMNPDRKFCPNDRAANKTNAPHPARLIMHLDMDAFFASVEIAHLPSLEGKPVIIGGDPNARGVVTTCSYEARKYGVHSAMSSAEAKKLCPHGIFICNATEKYSYVSMEIMKILSDFSPQVEPFSVDEAFLDITETAARWGGAAPLAMEIKRRIYASQRMTCSIGISAIRFVAKMASGAQKPDGLTIVEPGRERQFLWPQPIGNLWGVGPKSQEAFLKLGVNTIGELASYPKYRLKKYFGVVGEALSDMANGIGSNGICFTGEEPDEKSMGHEHTFDRDETDPERIYAMLLRLSDKVSRRLRRAGWQGRTITVRLKHSDKKRLSRAQTMFSSTDCAITIYNQARLLMEKHQLLSKPIRLIGVSVSHLEQKKSPIQADLISDSNPKSAKIDEVIDKIRDKYGEHTITYARSQLI